MTCLVILFMQNLLGCMSLQQKEGWVILDGVLVAEIDGIGEHMGDNGSDELVESDGTYSVFRYVLHCGNQCA